ncbi:DUF1801 domain-containing protein [Nocardioides coralli]|uniref:DUF1801 domain-containing protein n=1 Tax=Nocardioides coralli TaxID=2872154 RepID=UPI001CA3BEC0|nr:DUF1801 domain-containing protein [Nocardioides coralli]QZY29091.1 DUF1801 domain-containing protein [Nocardioides coralli]
MSERKTRPTSGSVEDFLAGVDHEQRRRDAEAAVALVEEVTGAEPVLWGSIIGFGDMTYRTADGKEHDYFAVGLSPRKANLTFYGLTYYGSNEELLAELGPHTTGKGCLYVKRLDDLDHEALRTLVARAWETNHQST